MNECQMEKSTIKKFIQIYNYENFFFSIGYQICKKDCLDNDKIEIFKKNKSEYLANFDVRLSSYDTNIYVATELSEVKIKINKKMITQFKFFILIERKFKRILKIRDSNRVSFQMG